MAIFSINKGRNLKPSEIKREIKALGDFSEVEYKKARDLFRNRLRNYEKTIGAKERANTSEELLRVLRRQYRGVPLTSREQQILATTSASTGSFAAQYERRGGRAPRSLEHQIIDRFINEDFAGLLQKSPRAAAEFNAYLNAHSQFNKDTGELIGYTVSARDVLAKLNEIAETLKNERKAEGAATGRYWRDVATT